MKKNRLMVVAGVLCMSLLFGACAKQEAKTDENKEETQQTQNAEEDKNNENEQKDSKENNKDEDKNAENTAKKEDKKEVEVNIYTADVDHDKIVPNKVKVKTVDAQSIFESLQKLGTIKKDAKLLGYEVKDVDGVKTAFINVSKEFYDSQQGADGEALMLDAFTKTFNENLKTGQLELKVDGSLYEGAHVALEQGMYLK